MAGSALVTEFEADWAPGEPKDAPGSDCVYADRSLGFKWKTGICLNGKPFFCAAKAPSCPPGYTWIPSFGPSCFKKSVPLTTSIMDQYGHGKKVYEQQAIGFCETDGYRHATVYTTNERDALANWLGAGVPSNDVSKLNIIYKKLRKSPSIIIFFLYSQTTITLE